MTKSIDSKVAAGEDNDTVGRRVCYFYSSGCEGYGTMRSRSPRPAGPAGPVQGHQEPGHHGRHEEADLLSICVPTTSFEPCAGNHRQALGPAFSAQAPGNPSFPDWIPNRAVVRCGAINRAYAQWRGGGCLLPALQRAIAVPCVPLVHFMSSVPRPVMSERCSAVTGWPIAAGGGGVGAFRCSGRHSSAKV